MLNIGPAEMVVIGIIVLLAVGPEQLPGVIRKAGQLVSQVRSVTDGFKSDFMAGIEEIEQAADLDKLSEQIVDPFNPATFEAQSKMSKSTTSGDSTSDDEAFDDDVYANRSASGAGDSENSDESEASDSDEADDPVSDEDEDLDNVDPDEPDLADVDSENADPVQVELEAAKLKAAKKRERSAAVVEAMHNVGTAPQAEADGANGEVTDTDAGAKVGDSSSDVASDRDEQLDSAVLSEDGVAE